MGSPKKFLLPSPNFNKRGQTSPAVKPHFLTPSGMTLHARHQPPPMYGKRGATYPAKFLKTAPNLSNNAAPNTSIVEAKNNYESQFCEACDMELQSFDDLRRHKAQHEKCPVDSCNYIGHPSVMDKHVTTLHNSGLFDKFKKLSTPEEIAAWRAERKRKYPTVENTLMRQKAKEQREKRGERLEGNKSKFGKYEDRKRAQHNSNKNSMEAQSNRTNPQNTRTHKNKTNMKRNNNKRRKKEEQQRVKEKEQNEKIAEIKTIKEEVSLDAKIIESCDGVIMFRGTSFLSNYKHQKKPKKPKEMNILSNLLGMYGSDDDSEAVSESSNVSENDGEYESLDSSITNSMSNKSQLLLSPIENFEGTSSGPPLKQQPNEDILNFEKVSLENESSKTLNPFSTEQPSTENVSSTIDDNSAKPMLCKYEHDETLVTKGSEKSTAEENDEDKSEGKELDCSDDETPEEAPIARSIDLPMPSKLEQPIKENKTTDNTCYQSPATKRSKADDQFRRKQRKSGLDYRKARLRKQNTLLEKLLETDIRHERNVLLQCVRYVCENNFFGIGQKKHISS